jgi:hypothetical protein
MPVPQSVYETEYQGVAWCYELFDDRLVLHAEKVLERSEQNFEFRYLSAYPDQGVTAAVSARRWLIAAVVALAAVATLSVSIFVSIFAADRAPIIGLGAFATLIQSAILAPVLAQWLRSSVLWKFAHFKRAADGVVVFSLWGRPDEALDDFEAFVAEVARAIQQSQRSGPEQPQRPMPGSSQFTT